MKKILIIVSVFTMTFCFSQNKTKYELKKEQLVSDLFKNLGIGEYEISLIRNEKDEAKKTNMFFSRLKAIPNSYENQQLIQQYFQDMQKANALKTKADFDKEAKAEEKRAEERKIFEKEAEKKKLEQAAQKEAQEKELFAKKSEDAKNYILKGDEYSSTKNFDMAIENYRKASQIYNELKINNTELATKLQTEIENKNKDEEQKALEEKKKEEKKKRKESLINSGSSILNSILKK